MSTYVELHDCSQSSHRNTPYPQIVDANVATALPSCPTKIPGRISSFHPFEVASDAAVAGFPIDALDAIRARGRSAPDSHAKPRTNTKWTTYMTMRKPIHDG